MVKPLRIVVVIEGGLMQCAVYDGDLPPGGVEVGVIDYDTEGAHSPCWVRQDDGREVEACVYQDGLQRATINLDDVFNPRPVKDDEEDDDDDDDDDEA